MIGADDLYIAHAVVPASAAAALPIPIDAVVMQAKSKHVIIQPYSSE